MHVQDDVLLNLTTSIATPLAKSVRAFAWHAQGFVFEFQSQ